MSKFIGIQYERFLNKKVFDENGCEPRYSSDAKFSINEYFIKKYLEKELTGKVSKLIQTARKDAEETIIKTLEQNLKDQLSIDIIKRLNIPDMLKKLQDKAQLLDGKEGK
jgi:SPX domain protein involved in polyphosphate accumulation